MIPRPYQITAKKRAEESWERGEGALLVMATGTGKTATGLHIAESFSGRIFWIAHREELLDQPLAALWYDRKRAGIVQAGRDDPGARILFASIATLANKRRLEAVLGHGYPELIVVDEAHHSVSPSHRRVIESLRGPGTRLLGLTATADREDDADLSEMWTVAYHYPIVEAVESGYLLPPYAAVNRAPGLDLSKVSGRRDYSDAELGEALLAAHIVEHTVAAMGETYEAERLPRRDDTRQMTAMGRACLVFTATVNQALLTSAALCEAGWRARWISGETASGDRRRLLQAFRAGRIDVLCNASVLTEGTDIPRCNCVVLGRPTKSWSLYVQMTGRGLRPSAGDTDCLVLDLCGATREHSLIAAPALIGGSKCPKTGNGVHEFTRRQEGGAECKCGATLPCWDSLLAGKSGSHKWSEGLPERRCAHCGRMQCQSSSDGRHEYTPIAGLKRQCMHCDLEIPMPLASLQGAKGSATHEPAAWTLLRQVSPHVEVLDLGDHGLLYLVGDDPSAPVWLPKRARIPRPLTDAPVDRWMAEAVASDLTRKARKGWDFFSHTELPGGVSDGTEAKDLRGRAAGRAVATGIAQWR